MGFDRSYRKVNKIIVLLIKKDRSFKEKEEEGTKMGIGFATTIHFEKVN